MSAFASLFRSRLGRRASMGGLLLVVAVAMSGCVSYSSQPTLTQVGDLGGLRFTGAVCSNPTGSGASPDGGVCGTRSDPSSQNARVLASIQVPTSVTPAATITATLASAVNVRHDDLSTESTTTLLFSRNTSYETQLATYDAPAAGYRWVGYVSEIASFPSGTVSGTGTYDLSPAFGSDGSLATATVNWVAGIASTGSSAPAGTRASAAIACGSATACIGDRRTGTTTLRTLVTTPVDVLTGTQQGAATPVNFVTRLSGSALPSGPVVSVSGTSSIAGATVAATSVTPTVGADAPFAVTLNVPANTALGTTGTVTVTLTTVSGETRTATANVVVTAAPVVAPPVTPVTLVDTTPAPTPPATNPPFVAPPLPAAPRAYSIEPITRCVTTRFRAATLRYTTSENLTATVLLQRRSARGALLRKCPSTVSASKGGAKAPTYSTTGRFVAKVMVGTHTVRLADLRPKVTLKPGAYRLLVQLRRADGTKAQTVTQLFIVLAK